MCEDGSLGVTSLGIYTCMCTDHAHSKVVECNILRTLCLNWRMGGWTWDGMEEVNANTAYSCFEYRTHSTVSFDNVMHFEVKQLLFKLTTSEGDARGAKRNINHP